jgi:hypothetical protein
MLEKWEYSDPAELETKEQKSDWVLDALKESEVDPTKEVGKPQIIFSIREVGGMQFDYRRVFTLGNFSAIIGKAKSKKTYLLSAISACIIGKKLMWDKFQGGMEDNKNLVLYFDTEQGEWDCWNVVHRIALMAGSAYKDKFKAFNLRRFSPLERCDIIEFALLMNGDEAGFVVIDGIADLATGINDEEEASRVSSLLLRWTKDYNCHIATVIHQNKNDNFATGHLGSAIMKKCEIIISVTKDQQDNYKSLVECSMSRGIDFKPFSLVINHEGMPEIDNVIIQVDNNDFERVNNELSPF